MNPKLPNWRKCCRLMTPQVLMKNFGICGKISAIILLAVTEEIKY
jgi:hypothetical protein